MSRINASEARGMMEAYNTIYASQEQEITEEQIWEEVENWVNSLLEEGYDLSEYTWEEMYEAYISEAPMSDFQAGGGMAALPASVRRASPRSSQRQTAINAISARGRDALFRAGGGQAAINKTNAKLSPRSSARVRESDVIERGRTAASSSRPARQPSPTPAPTPAPTRTPAPAPTRTPAPAPTRPAATTPRPTETKVRPSAPSGQTGDRTKDMATWAKANPTLANKPKTPNPLLAGGDLRRMQQASQMRQSGINVTSSQLASAERTKPSTPAAAPEVKKTAEIAKKPTQPAVAPSGVKEEYDAFDLVLEYLIDNGHVDTVDEALYVMMEMDAEVIQDIVEAKYGTKEGRHKLAMKRVKGEEIGKSGPGTGFKAVEKQAKKYGARDPKAVAAAAMYKTYGK